MQNKIKKAVKLLNEEGPAQFLSLINERTFVRMVRAYWKYKLFISPRKYFINKKNIVIDRPIFFLGVQGGGLTIISRMIRRHNKVVYIFGNSEFWSSEDEMDKSVDRYRSTPVLPDELSLKFPEWTAKHNPQDFHPIFGYQRGEVYATDELFNRYRKKEEDYNSILKNSLTCIIKDAIIAYAHDIQDCRFTDMSQTYTLKIPLLRKILRDTKFVLIVRCPYAWVGHHLCNPDAHWKWYDRELSRKERILFACQHWKNSFETALYDLKGHSDGYIIKIEEFLQRPEHELRKLSEFLELDFQEQMLPQTHHKLPFGSADSSKWYPVKKEINRKYYQLFLSDELELIEKHCGTVASLFKYSMPNVKEL